MGIKKLAGLTSDIEKAFKEAKAAEKVSGIPLNIKRAKPKTKQEITDIADRIARQQMGEHVTAPGETKNLAGRSKKESQRLQKLQYELERTKKIQPSPEVRANVGEINLGIPGDQTISDYILKSVEDLPIETVQEGGSRYGWGHLDKDDPLFWASNLGPARNVQNKTDRASQFFNTDDIMAHHMAMGPTSNNFAMHFTHANLKAINNSDIHPKAIDAFNDLMRQYFPEFPGVENPEESYLAMLQDSDMRKFFNARMKTPKITQPLGFPNGLDIQWAITEPELRNMEVGLTGHSVGRLKPGVQLTDTADHGTYTHGIQGEILGHAPELAPPEISFPDATEYVRAVYAPEKFTGTMQMSLPHQKVDPQYVDETNEYYRILREIRGFKKGGSASLEDEFRREDVIKSDQADSLSYAKGGNVSLDEEFRKADMFAGGGWSSKYTKSPKMPEYDLLPSAKTVKQVGKILGKKAQEEYGEETAKPTLRAIPDVALNVGADIVGAPADIANIVTKRIPIQSKARPFGIYEQLKQKTPEGEPMFGSENIRKKLRETGLVERERPLIETAIERVLPFDNKLKGKPFGLSIKPVSEEAQPFIGYITKSGENEMFSHSAAKDADYHHSFLVKNLDDYDKDSSLRFVRMGGENRFTLTGDSAIDPYHPESKEQISMLAKKLIDSGADPNAPFVISDMALPFEQAPYQNKEIGKLSDWYIEKPKTVNFVSSVEKAIKGHKMESMNGEQWANWMRANASKSAKKEAEATGLYDWLKSQGKVSKADIEAYVEGNLPQITRIEKGAPLKLTSKDEIRLAELHRRNTFKGQEPLSYDEYNELMRLENIRDKRTPEDLMRQSQMFEESAKKAQAKGDKEAAESLFKRSEHMAQRAEALELNPLEVGGSKFEKWKEPGGEKYRETLLVLPENRKINKAAYDFAEAKGISREEMDTNPDVREAVFAEMGKTTPVYEPSTAFRSKHWDEPNVLMHIRSNERMTPEGKRALFLEELQSDWAQKARKTGIKQDVTDDMLREYHESVRKDTDPTWEDLPSKDKAFLRHIVENRQIDSVPDAPYISDTGDWTKLGLKQALKDAIEGGHDYLAWTTGEQQAKRYDLSKQVSEIAYHPKGKALEVFDIEGNNIINEEGINPEDLADYIGKEAAEKVLNSTEIDRGYNILKGDNIRVGGEGMKAYYDRMVPQYMRDILKQYGITDDIKPIDVELFPAQRASLYDSLQTTGYEPGDIVRPARYSTQMGIEITPELREKILNEGLPHFKAGGSVDVVPFPRDN